MISVLSNSFDRLEELEQPAVVVVGVAQEAGEDLHHARVQLLLVGRQAVPVLHVGIVTRELGVLRDDAQLLLLLEHLFSIRVPAVVELPLVLVGPLLRDVVRCVRGAGAEVHEERLVRRDLLGVGDEADRLVHEVFRQVVALVRASSRARRRDCRRRALDSDLMRVAAQEAVVALETASERPAVVGPGCGDLICRRQVPFPERERAVSMLEQHFGKEAVLERDVAVAAGIAGRSLGDARHRVRVMVASREDARARRRAERRRVHAVEEQAVRSQGVDVRRLDRAAVAAHLAEAGVVLHDEQDVGCAFFGAKWLRPGRARHIERPADDARERCAGFVFLE